MDGRVYVIEDVLDTLNLLQLMYDYVWFIECHILTWGECIQ